MRRYRILRKALMGATAVLAGGTVLQSGCASLAMSVTPCGTVFTFCEPFDQAIQLFQFFDIPDWETDPSCVIPFGCGDGGLFPPFENANGDQIGGDPQEPGQAGGGGAGGGFGGGGGGFGGGGGGGGGGFGGGGI